MGPIHKAYIHTNLCVNEWKFTKNFHTKILNLWKNVGTLTPHIFLHIQWKSKKRCDIHWVRFLYIKMQICICTDGVWWACNLGLNKRCWLYLNWVWGWHTWHCVRILLSVLLGKSTSSRACLLRVTKRLWRKFVRKAIKQRWFRCVLMQMGM